MGFLLIGDHCLCLLLLFLEIRDILYAYVKLNDKCCFENLGTQRNEKITLKSQIFGEIKVGDNIGKGQRVRFEWDYKNQVRLVYVTLSGHTCVVNAYIWKIMSWEIMRKLKALGLICLVE